MTTSTPTETTNPSRIIDTLSGVQLTREEADRIIAAVNARAVLAPAQKPKTYRKKPVEIQAMHFESVLDGALIAEWCGGTNERSPKQVHIKTLEGTMTASPGDYVIRGVQGEFYPCKPDIFAATYEPVERTVTHMTYAGETTTEVTE